MNSFWRSMFTLGVFISLVNTASADPLYRAPSNWNLSSPSTYGWLGKGYWNTSSSNPLSQDPGPSISFGNWGDDWIGIDAVNFGGHQQDDSRPVNIYAEPYGAMNLGTALTVNMEGRIAYGMRAGLAPNGLDGNGGINSYPDFDAVSIFNYAGSSVPRFTTNGVIKDNEGKVHNVTFDKNHIYFDNAIPPEWIKLLRVHMHIQTNIVGSLNADANPHNRQPVNTWAADIVTWDPNGKWVQVEGWRVLGGNMATADYVPGQAVGKSGDAGYVAANTYDTKRSKYTVPTVFFGVYTKAFNRNTMCFLERGGAPGDANNPKGSIDAQTQECEGEELDLQNSLPDYEGREHGITITYNGPSKPTDDSYDMGLFGQNATMLRIWGGANTVDINGDAIWVHGDGGLQYATNNTVGSTQETAEFSSFVDGVSDMRLVNWLTRNTVASTDKGPIGYTTATMNIGLVIDGDRGHITGDGTDFKGTIQSQIQFNPAGNQGGLALCGYGGCSFSIASTGDASLSNKTLWMRNSTLAFVDTNGSVGAEIYTNTNGDVVLGSGNAKAHIALTYPVADGAHVDGVWQANFLSTQSASAKISDDSTQFNFGGQGSVFGWNLKSGDASSYLINVGHGTDEGFKFFNKSDDNPYVMDTDTPIVVIKADGSIVSQGDIVAYKHNIVGTGLISSKADGTPGAYFSTSEVDGGPVLNTELSGGLFHLQIATQADGDITAPSLTIHDSGDSTSPYGAVEQLTFMPRANTSGGIWNRGYRNEVFNSVVPDKDSGKGMFYFGKESLVSSYGGFRIDQDGTLYLSQSSASLPVIVSPELWAGMQAGVGAAVGQKQAFFETAAYVDGANNDRLVSYQQRENSNTGYTGASIHIAEMVDGDTGNAGAGTQQAELVFRPKALGGAVGLFGYNHTGLTVLASGEVTLDVGVDYAALTFDQLGTPGSNQAGIVRYCSNCYSKLQENGDTDRGIPVNWDGKRWNDAIGIPAQHD